MLRFLGSCVLFIIVSRVVLRTLKGVEEKPTSDNDAPDERLKRVEEEPMSDNNAPQIKYDVFVSFRGQDIRHGFLSHLTEAFKRKQINAFVDDESLKEGAKIWPSLVKAIEGSSISLIIFSQDYVSSRWCLEELMTILECSDKHGQIVIPVFYKVEPTDVGHQSSKSYKNAFAKHERKYESTKVQNWRDALKETAKISGIVSSNRNDAELVKEIVNLVLKRLVKPSVISKGLVGIDKKIATVESWIRKEPKHTRVIGIWGMGGVGKTTLAEEVFNKLQSEYDGCYFLANEREESNKHGTISLKENIFSGLLGNKVKIYTLNSLPEDIVRRIGYMKVLIVLDDLNESEHLEKLLGTLDNFGSGSRIIITTRDEQVLRANKANEIYLIEEFSFDIALELFNLNAFSQSDHQQEYSELSKKVVNYAQGIPLVVKVLAGLLHGKNKEEWESMLYKLKKMPPKKVYEVMKLSYDDLDYKGQQIFLDLACFFLRTHVPINVGYLKSLLKDNERDNSVAFELGRLKDKALVTLSKDNIVSMHDSLQEMAWQIVRQESIEDPGSRSRLWDPDDINEALKNDKVTEGIRSIQIELKEKEEKISIYYLATIKKQELSPHVFAKMNKLKFLEISGDFDYNQIILATERLQFLATELRYLCWENYPLKSFPRNFSAEKLVILRLREGRMEKLWDGEKNLVNLKELDLFNSSELKELPDLSSATNLEVLVLWGCDKLTSVHPSIFYLAKLEKLDLGCCKPLTIFPSDSSLCSLSYLDLHACTNLTEFSLISENMKELKLGNTNVKALPSSFGHQSMLRKLYLYGCPIERLPSSIINLTQLLHLDVSFCKNLETIPELPRFLRMLNIRYCQSLQTIQRLPQFLQILDGSGCESLKTVLFPSTAEQLKENRTQEVLLWYCLNLNEQSLMAIGLNAQINMMKYANTHLSTTNRYHVDGYKGYYYNCESADQAVYVYPGSSVPEWLEYKTNSFYVIIDLSSASPSPRLGFIFCFVLGEYEDKDFISTLNFLVTISDDEGKGKEDCLIMYLSYSGCQIESDYVCVMYNKKCSDFLDSRAKNQTSLKIEVRMESRLSCWGSDKPLHWPDPVLNGFGISPISTSMYDSFIQQMELQDSTCQFH